MRTLKHSYHKPCIFNNYDDYVIYIPASPCLTYGEKGLKQIKQSKGCLKMARTRARILPCQ